MLDRAVGIFGVGMIGASLALSLKRNGYAGKIIGFDREDISAAAVDRQAQSLSEFIKQSDLIVLATPLSSFPRFFRAFRDSDETAGKVITDVCSVKREVLTSARLVFGELPDILVPGHPLAGREKYGAAAALDNMFLDAMVILTPHENSAEAALERVANLWRLVGAKVTRMGAAEHDRLLAGTSHLPHVLASVLITKLVAAHGVDVTRKCSGGGLRSITRVAVSDPEVWREIFFANSDYLASALREFHSSIGEFAKCLENGDGEEIVRFLKNAQDVRGELER